MNSYKNVFELIDISSSEDEEGSLERASTPLPRMVIPNYRIVLETSQSSIEATADEEEYYDTSTDSLESGCKKMKLNHSLETLESELHNHETLPDKRQNEGLPDSPESPDESMSSDVFLVEEATNEENSISSSRIGEYLEQIQHEDRSSYFSTPPGTQRKISFQPANPLNDLEVQRKQDNSITSDWELPQLTFAARIPGRGNLPRGAALSQSAPGLGCNCKRIGIGRGHGCSLRFPKWYFNF